MIKVSEIEIQAIADYDEISEIVLPDLIDEDVLDNLKRYIGTRCSRVFIEYPYYDSDYLSTYYEHYAQKFRKYRKQCCRIHFETNDQYMGYITLRPTVTGTKIGKSYIAPELLLNQPAYLMCADFKAHVLGQNFDVNCFPWKKQDTDISVCAHTAAWTIIRYFGNKYNNYADATIGEIVGKTENDWGRKTPSLGLDPVQISDLFKLFGFSPLIIGGEKDSDNIFRDELIAYIESGLPMVGFLHPMDHAVSIVGHGKIHYEMLDDPNLLKQFTDPEANAVSHSKMIHSLYVMDDRLFPYREVPVMPDCNSDTDYGINEFYYAVVPLYNRMQLTYREVYNRLLMWIKGKVMNWEEFNICRIYITSANSLKRNALRSKSMPQVLKDVIATISLPRFVWCIDLAGKENYKSGLTSGRIIVDTTSATWETEPWILRHDMEKIEYKDYDCNADDVYVLETPINPYEIYQNNLKCVGDTDE